MKLATANPSKFRKIVVAGVGDSLFKPDESRGKKISRAISGNGNLEDPESRYFAQLADQPDINGELIAKCLQNIDLQLLREYIDWSPFFRTWDLHGKYPAILEDEVVGESAKNLYQDAQKMLDKVINEQKLKANGVVGFYPANTVNNDDIELYASDNAKGLSK